MSKLKFEQMHIEDQIVLLFKMREIIAENNCKTIHEFADMRGMEPRELWPELCVEAGFEECEPWIGYPTETPPLEVIRQSPGATRKMTGKWLRFWESYKALTGRDKN